VIVIVALASGVNRKRNKKEREQVDKLRFSNRATRKRERERDGRKAVEAQMTEPRLDSLNLTA
jgi:hypothetical protein